MLSWYCHSYAWRSVQIHHYCVGWASSAGKHWWRHAAQQGFDRVNTKRQLQSEGAILQPEDAWAGQESFSQALELYKLSICKEVSKSVMSPNKYHKVEQCLDIALQFRQTTWIGSEAPLCTQHEFLLLFYWRQFVYSLQHLGKKTHLLSVKHHSPDWHTHSSPSPIRFMLVSTHCLHLWLVHLCRTVLCNHSFRSDQHYIDCTGQIRLMWIVHGSPWMCVLSFL